MGCYQDCLSWKFEREIKPFEKIHEKEGYKRLYIYDSPTARANVTFVSAISLHGFTFDVNFLCVCLYSCCFRANEINAKIYARLAIRCLLKGSSTCPFVFLSICIKTIESSKHIIEECILASAPV